MRNLLCLAALALGGLGLHPSMVFAAEPSPLNEHLRPLAHYLGRWSWEWKNEHGEPGQSQSTVVAHPSGAFIIDRAGDIQDGKIVSSEFNIYYWQPESKTIATVGFTSAGDHGTSTLSVRGNKWIEQSAGFDAQGVLRTHIDQWEWSGQDTAVYQETHIFRAGVAEPDDFRLTCQRVAPTAPMTAKPPEPQSLEEHLKPLSRLVGKWKGEGRDEKGDAITWQTTVDPDSSGTFLVEQLAAKAASEDRDFYSEVAVYYWQPETKTIAHRAFNSAGGRKISRLFFQGNKWIEQATSVDAEGKSTSSIDQWEWPNGDTFVWQSTHLNENGAAKPDGLKYTSKRAAD